MDYRHLYCQFTVQPTLCHYCQFTERPPLCHYCQFTEQLLRITIVSLLSDLQCVTIVSFLNDPHCVTISNNNNNIYLKSSIQTSSMDYRHLYCQFTVQPTLCHYCQFTEQPPLCHYCQFTEQLLRITIVSLLSDLQCVTIVSFLNDPHCVTISNNNNNIYLKSSIQTSSMDYRHLYCQFTVQPTLCHYCRDTGLSNYRPVSNLHFISKIIEKLVVQRLEDHLCKYSLFDPLQSAYRSGHSTETALVKINNDIVSSLDGGQCVILASLDLSSAFDTVDHAIFL